MNDDPILEALIGGVLHWAKIAHGLGGSMGSDDCPLCVIFHCDSIDSSCWGCPVCDKSNNNRFCCGTPYTDWCRHIVRDHRDAGYSGMDEPMFSVNGCTECRRLAQEELMFLYGLLIEYKAKEGMRNEQRHA